MDRSPGVKMKSSGWSWLNNPARNLWGGGGGGGDSFKGYRGEPWECWIAERWRPDFLCSMKMWWVRFWLWPRVVWYRRKVLVHLVIVLPIYKSIFILYTNNKWNSPIFWFMVDQQSEWLYCKCARIELLLLDGSSVMPNPLAYRIAWRGAGVQD